MILSKFMVDLPASVMPLWKCPHRGHIVAGAMPIWVAFSFTWVSGDIQSQRLPRTMSSSMVLWLLGTALKSENCIITKGHIEAQGLGHNLRPWWCPAAIWLPEPSQPEWPFLPHRTRMSSRPNCYWRSFLGSWSGCNWGLYWCVWPMSPQGALGTMHDEIRWLY